MPANAPGEKRERHGATNDLTPVLLYDGECGVCARSVQFVLQRERPDAREQLRFAPLQGEMGALVRADHPEVALLDSVLWYDPLARHDRQVWTRSDAALAVLRHLGGGWKWLARLGALIPRPVRDAVYNAVARRRLALAPQACVLPTAEERSRFLR